MKTILATRNVGKMKEFAVLLKGCVDEVVGLRAYPQIGEVVEDGDTFEENALKKARAACAGSGLWAIADDSGLAVDGLAGAPGVYSARYAGENANDDENIDKLLAEMEHMMGEERRARFVCVIAVVSPDGREWTFRGTCEGYILKERMGDGGFGYDPIFWCEALRKGFGVATMEEKNKVSHRAKAMQMVAEFLRKEWA